jgi:signal peptidase I
MMTNLLYKLQNFSFSDVTYVFKRIVNDFRELEIKDKLYFIALFAFLYCAFFVFRIGFTSGVSMMPTYDGGEVAYVNMLAKQSDIGYGDIVAFDCSELSKDYNNCIKRVVGKPGDKVFIKHTVVYVNGQPLTRRQLTGDEVRAILESDDISAFYSKMSHATTLVFYEETSLSGEKYTVVVGEDMVGYLSLMELAKRKKLGTYESLKKNKHGLEGSINMLEVVLGEDEYFIVGDNRAFSHDSTEHGAVHWSLLAGKVEKVLFDLPW